MTDLIRRLKMAKTQNVQLPDYPGEAGTREVARDALAEIERLRAALKTIAYGSGEWLVLPEQIAREALGMVPADEQGAEMEK